MKKKILSKLSIIALLAFALVLSLGYAIYNCTHKKVYFK